LIEDTFNQKKRVLKFLLLLNKLSLRMQAKEKPSKLKSVTPHHDDEVDPKTAPVCVHQSVSEM
jgi:hypothetical protein